ncbi:MAG: nicotinate (nicotinamide) nucleotide adenylyltransferase [Denitrovibrio sp.]|nr:MAG: nicotinate (nicotinamide) nucleotide adenylyltransferase [Denitrovibrio sp.]
MKIGLFGGTFNPIHMGHLALAENVTNSLELDNMLFIPSKIPPHKVGNVLDPEKRLEMVSMVADKLGERYSVSDYEIATDGVSYTLKTLKHFRSEYPNDEIFFACGTDIFATIESWYEYQDLFEYVNFVVVSRSMVSFGKMLESIPEPLHERVIREDQFAGEKSGKIILYEMPPVDISSTDIREVLEASYRKANLPEVVYEYISEKGLYRGNE